MTGRLDVHLPGLRRTAIENRTEDRATGEMMLAGGQKMVAATFRHDTSPNLDPQLHTHCVIADMIRGGDENRHTMVDDGLYGGKIAPLSRDVAYFSIHIRSEVPHASQSRK